MLKVDVQGLCQVLHLQPGTDWGEGGEPTRHHQASQIQHSLSSVPYYHPENKYVYRGKTTTHPPVIHLLHPNTDS